MKPDQINVPASLVNRIISVGDTVTNEELDTYGKLREIHDRSTKLRTILEAWERQHTEERTLRKTYATWLLKGLFIQGVLVNLVFLAIGAQWIIVEPWVANSFILAVFAEIAAMTFFIIKYLFPKVSADVLATLEKL